MTTKYITTYVAAGYTLSAAYDTLSITSTGGVGGVGITSSHAATVINDGSIVSSGNAIFLSAGGSVINGGAGDSAASIHGNVQGGGGRLNVANYALIQGGVGAYNLSLSNQGTITGSVSASKGGAVDNGSASDTVALIGGAVYFGTNGVGHNFGTIAGRVVTGEYGTLTNGSLADLTATIEGGVYTSKNTYRTGSSIVNFGTIDGATSGYRRGGAVLRCEGDSLVNGGRHDGVALIYGSTYGVAIEPYIGATLRNYGSVVGGSEGVLITDDGSVINGAGVHSRALIKGMIGIDETTGSHSGVRVSNFGTVQGGSRRGVGVELDSGGEITNGYLQNHTALIEGYSGVVIKSGFLVNNFGTIKGQGQSGGYGVLLGTGLLTNGAAGYSRNLIEGFTGVKATGTMQTVTNFGTIEGGAGGAVVFGSATDVLVVENGCKFIGAVEGAGGTLDLDTGTGAVTGLTGEGAIVVRGIMAATTFSSFATLQIGHYANFKLLGSGSVAAGQTVSDAGVLALGTSKKASLDIEGLVETTGNGVLTLDGRITNKGTIAALGGTLVVTGALSGTGLATINTAATMEFTQGTAQNVSFTGTSGMLILAQSQAYTGAIAHFSYTGGTSLDLLDIAFVGGRQASYSGTSKSGVLTVTDGTHTAQIAFTGNYRASQFVVTSDGRGGVIVVDPTPPAPLSPPAAAVHQLVAAAASLGPRAASAIHAGGLASAGREALIAAPRIAQA